MRTVFFINLLLKHERILFGQNGSLLFNVDKIPSYMSSYNKMVFTIEIKFRFIILLRLELLFTVSIIFCHSSSFSFISQILSYHNCATHKAYGANTNRCIQIYEVFLLSPLTMFSLSQFSQASAPFSVSIKLCNSLHNASSHTSSSIAAFSIIFS